MPEASRRVAAGWRRVIAVLLVSASVSGCADEHGEAAWTTAVDTVGGAVHVRHTPGTDAGPTMVADEELRVGTVLGEGPESFGLIRSIAVLDDGRFAVADAQAEEVRLFDGRGRYLRTFGGRGQGPGELAGMQGVLLDHEGLLRVAEQENARLSVFHPDSGFLRSFPLRLFSFGFQGPWAAATDSTGRTMVLSSGQYGEGRFWSMVRVYDASMRQLDSILHHDYTDEARDTDDPPGAWRIALGNGFTYAQVPFFAQPRQIVGPTGELWATAAGATRLEVARWTPPSDTSLILRSLRQPVPVTAAERAAAMADVRSRLEERLSTPPALDPSRVPATKPPSYGLSLDERGRLWVRITDEVSDTTIYDVFESDGRYSETVAMPFRVDPWIPPTLRGELVWAVVRDESDVQHVVRARVRAAIGSRTR